MTGPEFDKEYATQPIVVIESEEIVDVPFFNESTRMPIPEKSYYQELLSQPIPLENRIAYLIPHIEPTTKTLNSYAIAKQIGAPEGWVERVAARIGIKVDTEGDSAGIFPPLSAELLEEEWLWYQSYLELDDQLTETAVAHFVARSPKWVRGAAHELGVHSHNVAIKVGRERFTYDKTLIPQLRHLLLIFPPAEDWCTKQELIELTGKDWPWIAKHLEKADIEIEKRRSPLTGVVYDYIAPESRAYLKEIKANLPLAAGSGLTIEGMSKKIGRSRPWVIRHMPVDYEQLGEERIDDSGKVAIHYFDDVWLPFEEQVKLEESNRRLAQIAIARIIGKSGAWIETRLPYTVFGNDDDVDSSYANINDQVIDQLKGLAAEEDADTRLTVAAIAEIVGHTRYWVKARIPYTNAVPEEKIGSNHLVYKPEVVEQLLGLPDNILPMGPKPRSE